MQRQFKIALENLEELKWKLLTKPLLLKQIQTNAIFLLKKKLRIILYSGSKSWNLGYNVKM